MNPKESIDILVAEHRGAIDRFFDQGAETVARCATFMVESLSGGGRVLIFGNGGSASDASHFAAELVNRFQRDRSPLAALALTTDPSVLTSIANDYGYEEVFSRQIKALGRPGDLAVGISTSGASENVVRGLEAALAAGMKTVILTGEKGRRLAGKADVGLVVPSSVTARIQEVHGLVIHIVCEMVEREMFPV